MNKMQVLGNVGGDATVKHFDNDRSVCNFSVAHTKKFTNKAGVKEEKTTWIDCQYWGKPDFVNKIAPYIKKGKKLYAEGEPATEAYIPNGGGDPKAKLILNVTNIEFADSAPATNNDAGTTNNGAAPAQANPAPANAPTAADDDDLPF